MHYPEEKARMTIETRLFATLREGRAKVLRMDMPDGSTIADVAAALSIDRKDLAIILHAGRDAPLDRVLSDGDTVSLFPPVGGG